MESKYSSRYRLADDARLFDRISNGDEDGPQTLLFHGDCMEALAVTPSESVQLVISSPPYFLGKEYEEDIFATFDEYLEFMRGVLIQCERVLKPGGSICWQVGMRKLGEQWFEPLTYAFSPIFTELGLRMKNEIIWQFGHGLHFSKRLSGRHEYIMWYTKGEDYLFNLDPIRVPQKYPNKRHFKGEKKGQLSGNPLGKSPGDVWEIPNVKSAHREKTEHPCQFPIEIPDRCIKMCTNEDDLVFDPFAGAGTTVCASLLTGRRCIGAELRKDYVDIAMGRLRQVTEGTLPVRESFKPIKTYGKGGRDVGEEREEATDAGPEKQTERTDG